MKHYQRIRIVAAALFTCLAIAFWQQTAASAKAAELWRAPLAAPLTLVHPYYLPNGDYSAGHRGVDYAAAVGQQVYSPTAAKLWFSGKVVSRSVVSLKTSAGELLEFEPVCSDLTPGTSVIPGQPIGVLCQADLAYRSHCQTICLHYSLRSAKGYLSPLVRTAQLAPTVLLPRTGFEF